MKALFERRVNYVKTPHNYGVAVITIYFLWIPIWATSKRFIWPVTDEDLAAAQLPRDDYQRIIVNRMVHTPFKQSISVKD
jgi:hypothetical protein